MPFRESPNRNTGFAVGSPVEYLSESLQRLALVLLLGTSVPVG